MYSSTWDFQAVLDSLDPVKIWRKGWIHRDDWNVGLQVPVTHQCVHVCMCVCGVSQSVMTLLFLQEI